MIPHGEALACQANRQNALGGARERRRWAPSSYSSQVPSFARSWRHRLEPVAEATLLRHITQAFAVLVLSAFSALNSAAQSTVTSEPWKGLVGQSNVRVIPRPFNKGQEFEWSIGIAQEGAQEVVFDTPDMMGDFVGAYVWTDRRLTLIAGETAAVIDIPRRTVVDVLLVSKPQISPDHRFLACLQIIPRYLDDGSALYKIYDVSLDRAANRHRPELEDFDSLMNGGIVVYPEFERLTGRTRRLEENVPHFLKSPLVWVSNTLLVFLDRSGRWDDPAGRLTLVSVDLRRSHKDPSVFEHTIDVGPLVSRTNDPGMTNPASGLQASGIDVVKPLQTGYQLRVNLIRNSGAVVDFVDVDVR